MGGKGSGKRKTLSSNPININDNQNIASTSTMQNVGFNQYAQLNPDQDISDTESMMSFKSQTHYHTKRRRTSSKNSDNQVPKSTPKPPPLNTRGKTLMEIKEILTRENIPAKDYKTRFVNTSPENKNEVIIYAENDDAYKKIKEKLVNVSGKFFTHQLRSEQTTKIVLHGFYKVSEDELKEKLIEFGLAPSKVKSMTVKKARYDDHCVYLIHFPKSAKVKISNLRENIKAIDQVIVRWEYFRNKRNGPIQCSNCLEHGHGAQSCFLDPKCVRCSKNHKSKDCPHLIDETTKQKLDKIPDKFVKCGLCGQQHTGNYSKCKVREEYIKRQQIHRARTQRRNRTQNQPRQQIFDFVPAPQLAGFELPAASWQTTHIPAPQQPREPNRQTDNNNLLSNSECLQLILEIGELNRNVKTLQEQFKGLQAIANKYFNNGFTR